MAFKLPFKNTPMSGQVRTLIYEEGGDWYGVALEFNIVEVGDSPQEVMVMLSEAIDGYIETASKKKLSIGVLNQKVNELYDMLWQAGEDNKTQKQKVYSTGLQPINSFA
jgi:predicted RNase H-like HicB family nuclease